FCPLASGAARHSWDRGTVSRLGGVAGTPRASAAEVSFLAAGMDGGEFSGGIAAADRISIRPRGRGIAAGGCLSRPRGNSSAEAAGLLLCGSGGAPRTNYRG